MDNYTMLLLLVSQDMDIRTHSPRCTMGDQLMGAIVLSSNQMGRQIMYTHWRKRLRLEDGNTTQDM